MVSPAPCGSDRTPSLRQRPIRPRKKIRNPKANPLHGKANSPRIEIIPFQWRRVPLPGENPSPRPRDRSPRKLKPFSLPDRNRCPLPRIRRWKRKPFSPPRPRSPKALWPKARSCRRRRRFCLLLRKHLPLPSESVILTPPTLSSGFLKRLLILLQAFWRQPPGPRWVKILNSP